MIAEGISWAPSRRVFLRRVSVTAAVTFAALACIAAALSVYDAVPLTVGILGAFLLTIGFSVDDLLHWRIVQSDRWQISDGHLIHDGPDGRAQIPLSDIADVWTQFGTRVIVKLASGKRIAIRYLPFPKATVAQIRAACPPPPPRTPE